MKLKQLSLLLAATIGIVFSSNAQFDFKAQFIKKELALAKTIVILTNDVDPNMDKANVQFEEAVRKYWSATKAELVTKKYSEVKNVKSSEIYFGIVRVINNGLYENKGHEMQIIYALTFLSSDKGGKLIMSTEHPRIYLPKNFDELDIIYAVRLLNSYSQASIDGKYDNNVRVSTGFTPSLYRLSELNSGKLKSKTLLLDKAMLHKKLNEEEIKSAYPYPYKLVSRGEILEAVKSNDSKQAYVLSTNFYEFANKIVLTAPVVVDAQTGNMLSYSKILMGIMAADPFNSNDQYLNPKRHNPDPCVITKAYLKEIVKNGE